ncbi:hypothetical protein EYC80_010787 [Monilinia laxa]|uniref:Uncharacterized protein n=1 Tax=Monilinia laxa TaxID=61186 RepID=A0A5N6JQ82_MONLA|nr:hypothetical protein EYC80_010787 [Monilinia laxa]
MQYFRKQVICVPSLQVATSISFPYVYSEEAGSTPPIGPIAEIDTRFEKSPEEAGQYKRKTPHDEFGSM